MAPPPTILVFDHVYDATGTAVPNSTVTCTLDSNVETVAGGPILPVVQQTTTDGSGYFQFKVVCNDLLSPSGSTYSIVTAFRTYQIAPQSANGTPQQTTASNVIVNAPQTLSPAVVGSIITTQDDLIVGGSSGPIRLAKGTNSSVLTVDPITGHLAWDFAPGPRQSIAYAASITPDLSQGLVVVVGTLTGDITVANPINQPTSALVMFVFTQDGSGNHAVNWGTAFHNSYAPSQTAGNTTYIPFITDGAGGLWAIASPPSAGGVASITAGTNITLGGTGANPIINAAEAGLLIPAHTPAAPFSTGIGTDPTYNFIAETLPRVAGLSVATTAPFTAQGGQIAFYAITLVAGTVVTHIAFEIGGTNIIFGSGGAGPHSWACLYDGNGNALAVSTDVVAVGGGNWSGTNVLQVFNIDRLYSAGWGASGSTSYTVPAGKSGIYYIGLMVYLGSAAGTLPQFVGGAANGALTLYRPAYTFQDQAATYGANTTAPGTVTPVTEVGGMMWGAVA